MTTQLWSARAAVALGILIALAGPLPGQAPAADGQDRPKAKPPADDAAFGLTKVHSFHLEFTAREWAALQAVRGGMFGGPKPPPPPPPGADGLEYHKGAGGQYPWAHADFIADGRTFKNAGVRYKGNFTYAASAASLKRPLQIDLDHYGDSARFHGQRKLSLAAGVTDPARTREALAFAVFRAAGVPAPRTAFATLTLTVPGKYDREHVGLYTVIEHVGGRFLKAHFKKSDGLLLKPEGVRGIEYLGPDWAPYEARYRPKSDATRRQKQRFIAFARLVNEADDEQFRREIGGYLDVDAFLRFLAVNALIANLDSFLAFGNN
jgi:spore coat protein CotH